MTTIVSNGYYLIADHRRSSSENSVIRNLLTLQVDSHDKASVIRKKKFSIHKDIAEKIEKNLTYPGQIRVTVIRERRAVGLAK